MNLMYIENESYEVKMIIKIKFSPEFSLVLSITTLCKVNFVPNIAKMIVLSKYFKYRYFSYKVMHSQNIDPFLKKWMYHITLS